MAFSCDKTRARVAGFGMLYLPASLGEHVIARAKLQDQALSDSFCATATGEQVHPGNFT